MRRSCPAGWFPEPSRPCLGLASAPEFRHATALPCLAGTRHPSHRPGRRRAHAGRLGQPDARSETRGQSPDRRPFSLRRSLPHLLEEPRRRRPESHDRLAGDGRHPGGALLYPGPILLDQSGIYNFVHEHETLFLLELEIPASAQGELNLKAHIEWLECDDKGCYPFEKDVSLTLKVGAGNAAYRYDPKLYPDLRPHVPATFRVEGEQLVVTPEKGAKVALAQRWFPERNFVSPGGVFTQKPDPDSLRFNLKEASEKLTDGPVSFVGPDGAGGFVRLIATSGTGPANTPSTPAPSPAHPTGSLDWQPWSPEAQAKALAAGQTVYIDFTARWCASCQVNKRVYTQTAVSEAIARHQVVLFKADWTRKDEVITAELKNTGAKACPLMSSFATAPRQPSSPNS